MKTFIKTKFKISDDQTNKDEYRLSAKKYTISYYIKINLTKNHYYKLLWSSESFEVNYNIRCGIQYQRHQDFESQSALHKIFQLKNVKIVMFKMDKF